MAHKQRDLISGAKLVVRQKENELKKLKREMYFLEQLILNDGYISKQRTKRFSLKCVQKFEKSKKRKKHSMLKAVMAK